MQAAVSPFQAARQAKPIAAARKTNECFGIQSREARRAVQKVAGGASPRNKEKKQTAPAGAKEHCLQNIIVAPFQGSC